MATAYTPSSLSTASGVPFVPVTPATAVEPRFISSAMLWPLSVEQYHRIGDLGIIHEDEPVELLDGLLIRKLDYFPEFAPLPMTWQKDGSKIIPLEWIYPLSVEQYHQMADAGILKDGDPVELLEGRLIKKMTKNQRHVNSFRYLRRKLELFLNEPFSLNTQDPITLRASEPEPDLTIFRETPVSPIERHPTPNDIALVIEVSDTTLSEDQGKKLSLYADARIPHYWIVNLIDNRVEWYTDPAGELPTAMYRQRADFALGTTLVFPLDGQELRVVVDEKLIPGE